MTTSQSRRRTTAPEREVVRELTRHEWLELAESGDDPRVSIYLATPWGSTLIAQRIAWTNLMRSTERQLATNGVAGRESRRLLTPARRVVVGQNAHAQGVAYLASAGFSCVMSLAIHVPSLAVVGDRCYLRPLLPLLEPRDHYYVLWLSRDEVRLFAGTRELVNELALDGLALAPLASMPRGVGETAEDVDKQRIIAHFREVDTAVSEVLRGRDSPLVLAGVGYLHALYRGVNSYPGLVPYGIIGGLGDMTTKQLHERAWPLVEATLQAKRRDAVLRFAQLHGSGRTVSELPEAANAADDGRLETLIVARADLASGSADNLHDDWRLLERAIAGTLLYDGTVQLVDDKLMPTSTLLAGILRD